MDYTVYPHSVCRGSNHLNSVAAKRGLYLYNQDRIDLSRIREKQFLVDSTTEHELPKRVGKDGNTDTDIIYFKSDVTFADVFTRRQVPKFRSRKDRDRSYCCSAFIEGYCGMTTLHLYNPFAAPVNLRVTAARTKLQTGYEDLIVHLFPSKNRHRGSQEAICKIAYEAVQSHEEIISSATDLCRHAWYAVREKTIGIKSPEGNLFYSVEILPREQ